MILHLSYLPVLPSLVLLIWLQPRQVSSQVINLRHPESQQQSKAQPAQQVATSNGHEVELRQKSKPGNVIVHFDGNHEVQSMQYVMQDGRFANLYQRPPVATEHLQQQQQAVVGGRQVSQRSETGSAAPNQTSELLNAKLNGVSQLLGERIVIELPDHSIAGNLMQPAAGKLTGGGAAQQQQELSGIPPEVDKALDGKLDVLATVAVDAIASGIVGSQAAAPKLRKAGIIMNHLKGKVSSKLRDLPKLVEAKLQSKSTAGQVFVERPTTIVGKVVEATGNQVQQVQQQHHEINRLPMQQQYVVRPQQYVAAVQPPVKSVAPEPRVAAPVAPQVAEQSLPPPPPPPPQPQVMPQQPPVAPPPTIEPLPPVQPPAAPLPPAIARFGNWANGAFSFLGKR